MCWVNKNVLECGNLSRYIEVFGLGMWEGEMEVVVIYVDGNVAY